MPEIVGGFDSRAGGAANALDRLYWSADAYSIQSDETHIVERVRLTKLGDVTPRATGFVAGVEPPINDDVLVFDITLTDPTLYDGPQRRIAYYQRMADNATLEYGCSKGLWFDQLEEQRIPQ